jgi:hypothetical protein
MEEKNVLIFILSLELISINDSVDIEYHGRDINENPIPIWRGGI